MTLRITPFLLLAVLSAPAFAERIGCVTTEWKLIGANHKVCVESFGDPKVAGVTCHVSQARTGGVTGSLSSVMRARAVDDQLPSP